MNTRQERLYNASKGEARRERSCYVCHGIAQLCTDAVCPIKLRAKTLVALSRAIQSTNLFGSSPPGVFVGQYGYPNVSMAPLIPPTVEQDTSIMDSSEKWLTMDMGRLLENRLSLLRARSFLPVSSAKIPPRILSTVQELVMSEKPVDTEVWFTKKPRLEALISPREAPMGPSANVSKLVLAENPSVPRQVDRVVSDTDARAELSAFKLYESGVAQSQITKIFSIGLLGEGQRRRLVPTEWSITAVDDILAKRLRRDVLSHPKIDQYWVLGHRALANNVQVLMMPTSWMYEALEAWLASPHPTPFSDYELSMGRKTYPRNLMGAYHAARLPVLEYLSKLKRQAGVIVFMEVEPEWIPLGVWRFREISREAFRKTPAKFNTMEEAILNLSSRLRLPIESWNKSSRLLRYHREQRDLEKFLRAT